MVEQTHTSEPWSYFTNHEDKLFVTISDVNETPISITDNVERAARIVDCVNACAGMIDPIAHIQKLRDMYEDLHAVQDKSRKVAEERDWLRVERSALLAALKGIIDNTTVEFAAANGFGEERNKACEVYDRIMWGTPNAGGAQ